MKKATFIAVLITVAHLSFARPVAATTQSEYSIKFYEDSSLIKIPATQEMLQEIINVTGLQVNFELKEAKVLNLEASISNKKRYILYNPSFISQVNNLSKDKWAVMALLAHEVGHHLNGHTIRKNGSNPALELEADEFAGFIMRKLGATLEESQKVMNYIAKTTASETHPSRSSRKTAIEKGWNKAASEEEIVAATKN